ncbi:DUF4249 domain-containing protein [Aquimarina sp. 2201CG1-2-11]|uniref:DUF4249 domain-containing protein n=1 Tax=Aquimarina discodermiae TaxID=3231043 RepID=UPI00346344C7
MKTYIKILLIATIALTSCTDVVDVEVPEAAPRLVVEASLDWEKGTQGNEQTIKLSTSTAYFDKNSNKIVTGASVKVTNDSNSTEFIFADQNNGEYTSTNFIPIVNQSYTLEIIYNNERYIAQETLKPVADIESVSQEIDDVDLNITVEFNDPEDEENFYFGKFKEQKEVLPELFYNADEFTNGNLMDFEYTINEEIEDDGPLLEDTVNIQLLGISERYYNYIGLLTDQAESDGGPFSTTPAPLRGNCRNITTPENYAFGYFRLSQMVQTSFTYSSK